MRINQRRDGEHRFVPFGWAALLGVMVAVVSACSLGTTPEPQTALSAPPDPVDSVRLDDAAKDRLQAAFDESLATPIAGTQTPGAVAHVSVGGDEWVSVLGVSDTASQAPMNAETHFRIASLTKPFVAIAILRLVDEGKLSLDDPLERYASGIANGGRITVRQLLAMSAGVWTFTADQELVARFDADPMLAWTVSDTIALIRTKAPDYEPGDQVAYSDSNYVLLGAILEKVTGEPASEVIRKQVLEPLGLTETRFPADDEPGVPDPRAIGYLPIAAPDSASDSTVTGTLQPVTEINPDFAWTSGAMTSTARDLARFARELTDGTLISPALQEERLQTRRFTAWTSTTDTALAL